MKEVVSSKKAIFGDGSEQVSVQSAKSVCSLLCF